MKARKFLTIGFSLTALALSGALVVASCAGGGSNGTGGSAGSSTGGSGGKGGSSTTTSASGGSTSTSSSTQSSGGSTGGDTGTTTPSSGGTGGTSDTTTTSSTPPVTGDTVTFIKGKASGPMTGYGWIALGALDTATSPTCKDPGGADQRTITKANPCPACGGVSKWSTNDSLCISGTIPKVTAGDAGTPDYDANWGVQIGLNAGPIDACLDGGAPQEPTLGKSFGTVTFNFTGSVTPNTAAVRGEIHRKGDPENITYCANILSGTPVALISFNTECWGGPKGVLLTDADVANIDKIGVQISSDTDSAYDVKDFCLTSIKFGAAL